MHPLVHAWVKDRLTQKSQEEAWLRTCCMLMMARWEPISRAFETTLQPHVHNFLSAAKQFDFSDVSQDLMLPIKLTCGNMMMITENYVRAQELLQEIHQDLEISPSQPSRKH